MAGVPIQVGTNPDGSPILEDHYLFAAKLLAYPETVDVDGVPTLVLMPASSRPIVARDEDGQTVLQPRNPLTRDIMTTFESNEYGFSPVCFLPRLDATYDAGAGPQTVQSSDADELIQNLAGAVAEAAGARTEAQLARVAAETAQKAAEDAQAAVESGSGPGAPSTGLGSGGGILLVLWVDGAWSLPTLESAIAAGYTTSVLVWFVGGPKDALPDWRPAGRTMVGLVGATA